MPSVEAYWVQAIKRDRVWADTHNTHKMGWVNPGDQMKVVEVYNTWLRFDEHNATEVRPFVEGYKEWWIKAEAVVNWYSSIPAPGPAPDPNPVPVPTPDTGADAELGKAFRLVGRFLADRIHEALS